MTSRIPNDLKYTSSHEWVREENDGTVTVGISDHAQSLLGDIVYVELPEKQHACKPKESFAVVESVKAAADVYSPVAGEVIEANQALSSQPELINIDPYGDGWLCRIKLSDKQSLTDLLSPENYLKSLNDDH